MQRLVLTLFLGLRVGAPAAETPLIFRPRDEKSDDDDDVAQMRLGEGKHVHSPILSSIARFNQSTPFPLSVRIPGRDGSEGDAQAIRAPGKGKRPREKKEERGQGSGWTLIVRRTLESLPDGCCWATTAHSVCLRAEPLRRRIPGYTETSYMEPVLRAQTAVCPERFQAAPLGTRARQKLSASSYLRVPRPYRGVLNVPKIPRVCGTRHCPRTHHPAYGVCHLAMGIFRPFLWLPQHSSSTEPLVRRPRLIAISVCPRSR